MRCSSSNTSGAKTSSLAMGVVKKLAPLRAGFMGVAMV